MISVIRCLIVFFLVSGCNPPESSQGVLPSELELEAMRRANALNGLDFVGAQAVVHGTLTGSIDRCSTASPETGPYHIEALTLAVDWTPVLELQEMIGAEVRVVSLDSHHPPLSTSLYGSLSREEISDDTPAIDCGFGSLNGAYFYTKGIDDTSIKIGLDLTPLESRELVEATYRDAGSPGVPTSRILDDQFVPDSER